MVRLGVASCREVKTKQCALLDDGVDCRSYNPYGYGIGLTVAILGIYLNGCAAVGCIALNLLADGICLRDLAVNRCNLLAIDIDFSSRGVLARRICGNLHFKIVIQSHNAIVGIVEA